MRTALVLFGYALTVAWWAPAPLRRLTAAGISPGLGLAAWLTAMTTALVSAGAALVFLARAAAAGWTRLAEVVCRSFAGHTCARTVYSSAVFEAILGAITLAAVLAAALVAWRYGRSIQRSQRETRAHAEVARITGRELPGTGATVLDAARPAAYCLAGRPATIVLTRGAVDLLDAAQLGAVLAHERAHLARRHHQVIALTRALAAAFPAVPVFAQGARGVVRMAEMTADDDAAQRSGRPALITALLAMATGARVPAGALGATACAVTDRLRRLAGVPSSAQRTRCRAALASLSLTMALAPALLAVLAS